MNLPIASAWDPVQSIEGSLDPLGTYSLSESLASMIGSAGVRERQSNLRFLTLCCVGWNAIAEMDHSIPPSNDGSEPEQCFEWLLLQSIVENASEEDEIRIPGILKAKNCKKQKLNLSAELYLRNPRTFGFFGVYRSLANNLGLVSFDRDGIPYLEAAGARILDAWRSDEKLSGFGSGINADGKMESKNLVESLNETKKEGHVVLKPLVKNFIRESLAPGPVMGKNEKKELHSILYESGTSESDENRRRVIDILKSKEAVTIVKDRKAGWERTFHEILKKGARGHLARVIDAIIAYEDFIGLLNNSFEEIRRRLSPHRVSISLDSLTREVVSFSEKTRSIPQAYKKASTALAFLNLEMKFTKEFEVFSPKLTVPFFLETLLQRHEKVQSAKPPMGKAPWFERNAGKIAVRPLYRIDHQNNDPAGYIYFYRTRPLFNFLLNMGAING